MKSVKVIIAIVLMVTILVSVMTISGTSQALLDKLAGISSGSGSTPDEPSGESGVIEEDKGDSNGSSSDIVIDDAISDVTEGATLVWSEDFEDFVINVTTDNDGNNVYSSDNYLVYYDDGTLSDRMFTRVMSNGSSWLWIMPEGSAEAANKPNMQLAFDFTGDFNKKNLALSTKKFIIFEFVYGGLESESDFFDIVHYRYNIVSADGEKTSVLSNSLWYSNGGFNGVYAPANASKGGTKIVALIAIDEDIEKSDLYYFIDNTEQVVVHEDFLKSDSSYVGAFEVLFLDPLDNQTHIYDDFKIYTFPSDYEGNISNALKEINFIN